MMLAAADVSLFSDTKFWVGAAFIIFVLFLVMKGVPALVAKALDDRADAIRKELDDARSLRVEAQDLLAEYQKKAQEAEAEAQSIIDQAKRDAEALAAQTRRDLQEMVARRAKQAEDKIARAEAQAIDEVRDVAIEKAIAASETIFKDKVVGSQASQLIDRSIQDLRGHVS